MTEEGAQSRYTEIINEFINLAINRFSWEGLPSGLTSEQLELLLINKGQLMYFKNEQNIEMLLPCFGTSDLNVYGLPTKYTVNSENALIRSYKVDISDGVLLKNNPLGVGDFLNIDKFAERIDNIEMTQDVNLFQQCVPKIILADEDSKLTAKTLFDKIKKFKYVVFGKKSLASNITTTDVLDTSSPYLMDKLQQQKTELRNELLSYLGINTVNIMKKERVNTEEVNANNDYTETILDLMFDLRVKFCNEVYSKFGRKITVKKREVEESGTQNANIGGNN